MTIVQQPRYTVLSQLGEGKFGKVSLACDPSGKQIAIKHPLSDRSLYHERSILIHLQKSDPILGIPRLLDTLPFDSSYPNQISLVLEYVEGQCMRDLAEYSLPLLTVIDSVTEFLCILARLHARRVAHEDLHDKNILLDKDGHIHVIDFGFASLVDDDSSTAFEFDVMKMMSLVKHWMAHLPQQTESPLQCTLLSGLDDIYDAFWEQAFSSASLLAQWQDLLQKATRLQSTRLPSWVKNAVKMGDHLQALFPFLPPSMA